MLLMVTTSAFRYLELTAGYVECVASRVGVVEFAAAAGVLLSVVDSDTARRIPSVLVLTLVYALTLRPDVERP